MRNRVPLLLLFLLLVTCNILWYRLGGHPQHWDSAIHLSESLNADHIGQDSTASTLHQALNVSWYYPPFTSYASILVYRILGESEFSGLQVMTLFYITLVLSVYAIGKELFGELEGLVAAFLIAACPLVIQYSHMFMLDLPLAAMAALSLYLLIRTGTFRHRTASFAFGAAIGAGVLTKWTFPFFILAPFLHVAFSALRRSPGRRQQLVNCILSVITGSVVAAPWYLVHAIQIISSRGGELGRGEDTFAASIVYYLRIIPEEVSWFFLPVVIGGVAVYLTKYRFRAPVLILSFIGGYVLLTLISFKQPRFSLPLLAPLVVMASAGLVAWVRDDPFPALMKRVLISALVAVPLVQLLVVSFVPPQSPAGVRLSRRLLSASIEKTDGPVRADWKQDSIVQTIDLDRSAHNRERANVRVIPDYVYFNNATLSYAAKLRQLPIVVMGTTGYPLFTDYVILKSGNTGDDAADRDRLRNEILSEASLPDGICEILRRWKLPDGSEGILLRVGPRAAAGVSCRIIEEKLRIHTDQFLRKYFRPGRGYELKVDPIDSVETVRGHVQGITFSALDGEFGDFTFNPDGLPVERVRLTITDVRFDPGMLAGRDSLRVLSIGGLRVESFAIASGDLRRYAERSSSGSLRVDSLSIAGGVIHFEGSPGGSGPKIEFDLRLFSDGRKNIRFSFVSLRIGILPIPSLLVNVVTSSYNPVLTGLDALSEVTIGNLSLENNQIRIGE